MEKAPAVESGHFHAVKFYQDAASLAQIVCAFLAEGLKQDQPAVVIATPEHLSGFRTGFAESGIDVDAAIASESLTFLDANEMLSRFMLDGIPTPQLFQDTIGPILTKVNARYPGATIRAYGEMVDVLWKRDQTVAAIRLETLWNDLARSHSFKLLCGYSMGSFYKGSATDDICSVHSHVVSATGSHIPVA